MNFSELPLDMQTYILKQEEARKEFMKVYDERHALCPKCGHTGHSTTFAAFIMDADNREAYVDRNHCVCSKCGDKHIAHDRISKEEWDNKSLG